MTAAKPDLFSWQLFFCLYIHLLSASSLTAITELAETTVPFPAFDAPAAGRLGQLRDCLLGT